MPEQRERRVGEGEPRVECHGLAERRIGTGLHAEDPTEPDVVGLGSGRTGREWQPHEVE